MDIFYIGELLTHGLTLLCICHPALSANIINMLVSKAPGELTLALSRIPSLLCECVSLVWVCTHLKFSNTDLIFAMRLQVICIQVRPSPKCIITKDLHAVTQPVLCIVHSFHIKVLNILCGQSD